MNSLEETLYDFLSSADGLNLNEAVAQIIVIASIVLLWIIFGIVLQRVLKFVIFKTMRVNKKGPRVLTVSKLLNSILKYVLWFIVILMILKALGVDITPFIASAGVVGLAVGFGAQEIVRDFISGFFIIFEGSFDVGDVIEVDGFKGNVLSLGLRTTVIKNWLGEVKTINNGNLGSIINYSKNDSFALVDFGVAYDTDLDKLKELMLDFVVESEKKYDVIIETPQFLGVIELADSSINLRMIAKTGPMQHFQVQRDLRKDLVAYLTKNGIEIPFPQVVVHNA